MALLVGRKGYFICQTLIHGKIVSHHQLGGSNGISMVEILNAPTEKYERAPAALVKMTAEDAINEIDMTIRYWQDRRAELVAGSI